jgi:hypothetical protein
MKRPPRKVPTPAGVLLLLWVTAFILGCEAAAPRSQSVDMVVATPSLTPVGAAPTAPSMADAGLPTLVPESVLNRRPSRVVVPDLHIDLPVVEPPPDPAHFPFCNVAEYLPSMSRPGQPGTTYLYAHARTGMFLPILEAAQVRRGRSMLGMEVDVYTSDAQLFTYTVTEVRLHVVSLESAYLATIEQLILQTSEGPRGTPGKTMLIAAPRGAQPATPAEAMPAPKPVRCQ